MQGKLNTYSQWSKYADWQSDNTEAQNKILEPLKTLVTDRGSLTQALKTIDESSFEVEVLSEEVACPYPHEQIKLNRSRDQHALILSLIHI